MGGAGVEAAATWPNHCSDSAFSPLHFPKPKSFFSRTAKPFPINEQKRIVRANTQTIFVAQISFSVLTCKKIGGRIEDQVHIQIYSDL